MVMTDDTGVDMIGKQDSDQESSPDLSPPVLVIKGSKYPCRDLSGITYNEQIMANTLMDKMSELQENMREWQELNADDEDEWGDIPEPPEELEEAWRRYHKRTVRFAYPDAPKDELSDLSPAEVAHASSKFTNYMMRYGQHILDSEGNESKPSGNRKSRRASRKRAQG